MTKLLLRAPRMIAWCALCLAVLVVVPARATTVDLKVMSFNVRFDDGNALSSNGWYTLFSTSGGRRDRAVAVIQENSPDLLGTEEVLPNQLNDLKTALTGHGYYGLGRDPGDLGEHSGIFFRASRFTDVGHGDFWLSSTPNVPGTTFVGGGSDTGNARLASWVKLYDNQSQQTYFVLNTHWSLDTQARNQSATLIRNQINQLSGGLPLIVMGDFNTTLNTTALQTLTGATVSGFKLQDAYRQVFPTVGPNEATFHNFTGARAGSSIDHIFASPSVFTATKAEIVYTQYQARYPSDHFPITATLRVAVVPEPASLGLAGCGIVSLGIYGMTRRRTSTNRDAA